MAQSVCLNPVQINHTCSTNESHILLSNLTQHTIGGLGWLDDLPPFGAIGLKIADFELLKSLKPVATLLDKKTIGYQYVNAG